MKRITITTLTIGLISLVILLIATMLAQRMSKEGLAGAGGISARFFTSGTHNIYAFFSKLEHQAQIISGLFNLLKAGDLNDGE